MSYTVHKLATLAGVSVRTLHHYDAIGLLSPARKARNGYREYGEKELLELQQIMFFRELEFPLEEIKTIMQSPWFDMSKALLDHRKLIELRTKRLAELIGTIDKTLKKLTHKTTMEDQELYGTFSKEEAQKYAAEAKERWGNTEAYKQSRERVKKMGKEGMAKVMDAGKVLLLEIVSKMDTGPESPEVQALIAKHYDGLRAFYEPNLEMYRGLGHMYAEDPRFAAFYNKVHPNLAVFMRDAITVYCDTRGK